MSTRSLDARCRHADWCDAGVQLMSGEVLVSERELPSSDTDVDCICWLLNPVRPGHDVQVCMLDWRPSPRQDVSEDATPCLELPSGISAGCAEGLANNSQRDKVLSY